MKNLFVRLAMLAIVLGSTVSSQGEDSKITAALKPFVERHGISGAVTLVANKEKVLSLDVVGSADIAANRPMAADSIFWIASMSKPITGTALMLLVDEEKVKLDDPVEKYLPEFRNQMVAAYRDGSVAVLKRPKHPITVRNVLSHTSGLPFRSQIEEPTLDRFPLKEAVLSYAMTPLDFEPDTKYQYSNAGINTAGRIIEVVSGMPFETFVEEKLFKPLGMKDTSFWLTDEQVSRLAKSYRPNEKKDDLLEINVGQLQYPLTDRTKRFPMPAGGYFSTAGDMGRFCQMLLNGGVWEGRRYLSESAIQQMTSKQTGDALKDNYGLGWSAGVAYGHGGAHATNMSVDTSKGLVYIWMIQSAGGFPADGDKAQGEFRKTADQLFAK